MNYVIDGLFLIQKITGIQRFAYEICKELDKICNDHNLEILVPENSSISIVFTNIKLVKYGKHNGRLWEQIDLGNYLKKNNKEGIFLTNELPLFYRRGIICIHDISYKVNPRFFTSLKDRISSWWHRVNYYAASNSKMSIITVSHFSKSEIERVYDVDQKRITVINNSWQHMNEVEENCDLFRKYNYLEKSDFYFSMSTLAVNKNFKWVLCAAKNNSDYEFAIAGGGKLKIAAEEMGFANLPNVHFLGYVSDEDAKALMHHCKAFLFPTFYEGFGIPPLEAVACGCKNIIVSDIPVMHEIYGDYANYIDPNNYDDNQLSGIEEINDIEKLLSNYSWKESAEKLYDLLKNEDGKQ